MDRVLESEADRHKRRLRRDQAAAYIREKHGIPCSPRTLAKKACIGGGPPFRKANRVPLYEVEPQG